MTEEPSLQADIARFVARLAEGRVLALDDATRLFEAMMQGLASEPQIAAVLVALRVRGEAIGEIHAAARVMRRHMIPVEAPLDAVDLVGTGGDGLGTLNVSTAAALVVAGAGVPVAKHGNYRVSSQSGAADLLAACGFDLAASPDRVARAIRETGFGFMLAPNHHPAVRHVMPVRRELAIRTVFNFLGPMTNPASVRRLLIGCADPAMLRPMAETLRELGSEHVWVVHGAGGADELTLCGPAQVVTWNRQQGKITEFSLSPQEAGLPEGPLPLGGTVAENADALRALLDGAPGPYRDTVLFNAAASLVIAGKVGDLAAGVEAARQSLDQGRARQVLARAAALTRSDVNPAG